MKILLKTGDNLVWTKMSEFKTLQEQKHEA